MGTTLTLVYLGLFLLAWGFVIGESIWNPLNSEMSGIFVVLLTLPWSLVLTPIWETHGYIEWYGKFGNSPVLLGLFEMLPFIPGVLINAVLAYWLGKLIERDTRARGDSVI